MRGEIAKLCRRISCLKNESPAVIVRESGRSSIPETLMIESKSRGVLDTPHARGMTKRYGAALQ
jgi:hypothetical protein